jgi:hypothetical protein
VYRSRTNARTATLIGSTATIRDAIAAARRSR